MKKIFEIKLPDGDPLNAKMIAIAIAHRWTEDITVREVPDAGKLLEEAKWLLEQVWDVEGNDIEGYETTTLNDEIQTFLAKLKEAE